MANEQLIKTIFSKIDTDGSGSISKAEMDAVFRVFDQDGSLTNVDRFREETISFNEHKCGAVQALGNGALFYRSNYYIERSGTLQIALGNGSVSLAEFTSTFQSEFSGTGAQAKSVFNKLDKDGSGDISMDELGALFKEMDKDGDGSVTFDEFKPIWTSLLS